MFYSNSSSKKYCDDCVKDAICYDCGKDLGYKVLKSDKDKRYCRKCSYKHRKFNLKCKKCGELFLSNGSSNSLCIKCKEKEIDIRNHTCSICKKYNPSLTRDQNGRGYECGCHNKWNKEHWSKINKSEEQKKRNSEKIRKYLHSKEGQKHIKNHNKELNRKLKIENGVTFIKENNYWIKWEDYKANFISQHKNIKIPKDFILIPTFRSIDSKNWIGSKTKFEQFLIDNNINWFIYIKFAIDKDNKTIPIVIGKTGSKNVNFSGTDVDFGEYNFNNKNDYNNTKSRKLLFEENMKWLKTHIAILPCKNEEEAYEKEKQYLLELNLLQS